MVNPLRLARRHTARAWWNSCRRSAALDIWRHGALDKNPRGQATIACAAYLAISARVFTDMIRASYCAAAQRLFARDRLLQLLIAAVWWLLSLRAALNQTDAVADIVARLDAPLGLLFIFLRGLSASSGCVIAICMYL